MISPPIIVLTTQIMMSEYTISNLCFRETRKHISNLITSTTDSTGHITYTEGRGCGGLERDRDKINKVMRKASSVLASPVECVEQENVETDIDNGQLLPPL